MQTLGLSGESKRSDGRLKSIFWPTVENAWDVNYLGEQGFWICILVGVLQLAIAVLSLSFSGNLVVFFTGTMACLVFLLGGMGVREANWPAAAMVFSVYFAGMLGSLASGQLPGILTVIVAAVLLSNVRAAFLASEWRPAAEGEDRPTRFNETLSDKIADQLPAKLWPVVQVPFFALAAVLLVLELAGSGIILAQRMGILSKAMHLHP